MALTGSCRRACSCQHLQLLAHHPLHTPLTAWLTFVLPRPSVLACLPPLPPLVQYYFETIFPRIPKKAADDIQEGLRSRGLATSGKGNGGAGGTDRRGGDDGGNRRPASVKASLSVAFGQRAPNRSGAREDGARRGEDRAGGGGRERERAPPSRSPQPRGGGERERERSPVRGSERDRYARDERDRRGDERVNQRGDGRDRYARDERDRRPAYGGGREPDRYASGREPDRYASGREADRYGGSRRERELDHSRRSRSRSRDRRPGGGGGGGGSGRDAHDVFRDAARGGVAADDLKGRYGDANGTSLYDSRDGGPRRERGEEVYRLGGSSQHNGLSYR